jgi:glycosyltransferase involved in cell wall biosynthesis
MQEQENEISVIMPAYNEGPRIFNTIQETVKILEKNGIDHEIIIVDDGSSDSTHREAERSMGLGNIRCIRYEKNMGKGHAIKKGFEISNGKLITFIDADMDLHPSQIPLFREIMTSMDAEMVAGSKRHPRSQVSYPWTRKMFSLAYRVVIKFLFNLSVKDTQVGLKLIKREILDMALPVMEVERYAFDLELMVIANKFKFKIVEAPVILDSRKPFARIRIKDIYVIFMNTLSVFYGLRTKRYDHAREAS